MTWFSFTSGYGTIDFTGAAEKAAAGLGFHGYATEAQAKAAPNSVNALQAPALLALIDQQAGALPSGLPGSGAIPPATSQAVSSATGLAAIGDFFSRLTKANTWLRVGEVILGLALLSIGLGRITGTTSAAEKIASRIPGVPL